MTAGDTQVIIEPKVTIRNVLAMITRGSTNERWQPQTFDFGHDRDLLSATVDAYIAAMDRAMTQGVRHDYVAHSERLNRVRGRINIAAGMRRPGIATTVLCDFDEYTPDNGLNQLLLAAIRRCYQIRNIAGEAVRLLHRAESRFEGVSEVPDPLSWADRWVPTRLDQHFAEPVRLAELILRNFSVAHRTGTTTASAFLVDMNHLVETFVTGRVRVGLRSPFTLSAKPAVAFDVAATRTSWPDLVLMRGRRPALVADVKYKTATTFNDVSAADLYQVTCYAQSLNLSTAALVMCGEGGVPASIVTRTSNVEIWLLPVNLRGPVGDLTREIGLLASRLCGLSATDDEADPFTKI